MSDRRDRAVAVVGLGAILPDAPSAPAFWKNLIDKRYAISEVPPERWSLDDYYDPDPAAPDKTYSKIGGWVRGFAFDWKKFTIPPRVAAAMDEGQQWAVTIAAEALADYGYPSRPLDLDRTGVILGAAMGGELHYLTTLRVMFPEFANALGTVRQFADLPGDVRRAIVARWREAVDRRLPPITEDSMPGELPNVLSGRVANVLNLRGPNFITDAACASSFAAIDAAVDLLVEGSCDAVISGGVDRNMGASTFVKFCKIGALSATGTRPFGDGADGFVMGEGCAAFLLKRLADAERDGDRVYAVIRGVGGSSDGKGKGITAPNPVGQKLAVQRAWQDAGLDPASATLVEAHGTSTKVGDVVEVGSLGEMFRDAGTQRIALGSAKSNVGHLKAGAGAAGLLKAVYALHYKVIPPTLNARPHNPNIDFASSPFYLADDTREWSLQNGSPRRCGVSAYGFGGTNFHLVLEEHRPGALTALRPAVAVAGVPRPAEGQRAGDRRRASRGRRAPLRGLVVLGAASVPVLKDRVEALLARVRDGHLPPVAPPPIDDLQAPERLAIDFGSRDELVDRLQKAERALAFDTAQAWKALAAQGLARGSGPRVGKMAFLFPGQGSQYVNMGKDLAALEPAVAATFAEADAVMAPILGAPLTSFVFVDEHDTTAVERAEDALRQTAITQPSVLTVDAALQRLLADFGIVPDFVMGHSLGEYAALVAAGVMPFADALEAAAARGREMTRVSLGDNGWMAAVMAPLEVVEKTLATVDGYVVAANINSYGQAVIGGETTAVQRAMARFAELGHQAVRLPVSHAFHTRIVAPASGPLRQVLDRLRVGPPQLPLVANVTGERYPSTADGVKDLLEQQIASPVQWVKGLETLYREGVRTFVEVGPKKALKGFVDDVLGSRPDVVSLFSNHPKPGGLPTFNQMLCGLYAAGYGVDADEPIVVVDPVAIARPATAPGSEGESAPPPRFLPVSPVPAPAPGDRPTPVGAGSVWSPSPSSASTSPSMDTIASLFASALQAAASPVARPFDRNDPPTGSVVITGTGLGLPGAEKAVMDPANAERILRGEQFIDLVPERFRVQMARRHVTRVVKAEDGSGSFQTIDDTADVIKLAGRPGSFDLTAEFGVPEKLVEALDTTTQLAMAAGIDALREAGIPLVQTWRKTTTGKFLPDRWMLPEPLRDDTGVVFASAFPGMDRFADEAERYHTHEAHLAQREMLEQLRQITRDPETLRELQRRLAAVEADLAREPYAFDRRFILRVLAMGHSQFAEYIGARGPNAHVNAACAATAQGLALAEDWIRAGRCRRVVVIGADNVTSEKLLGWVGAGFLATGAAATDDKVTEAAVPFDRRRHGTILGMGACGLVVESQDAVEERGMRGIVELLSTETRNSAFHATRLDVDHVAQVVESLVAAAERRFGINRHHIAPETVFVSHETFTPARGGSASAEVAALRRVFGPAASEIVVANTKGFTGHPMGVGVEDVIAVKILEHAIVPPVPNYKEVDPDLGPLTLSRGGRYPVKYAIHLAAGFGSQIALTLTRRIPGGLDRIDSQARYQTWLDAVSGYDRATLETVKRTLRVASKGVPARTPEALRWTWGTGPVRRSPAPGDRAVSPSPLPVVVQATPPVSAPAVPTPQPSAAHSPDPGPPALPRVAVAVPPPPPAASSGIAPRGDTMAAEASRSASGEDGVRTTVLGIVAEKTGYPSDMLELDLDLEADLGVDTVKQAETFAAVREAYGIPRLDDLKLRDFPTLRHVVGFVLTHRPDLAAATPATASPAPAVVPADAITAGTAAPPLDSVMATVLGIVAEKTGYPSDMLELDLDLEADLGVDTVKQAETFAAVREAYGIPRLDDLKLRDFPTLRHVVGFVHTHRPDLAAATPATASPAPAVVPADAITAGAAAPPPDPVMATVLGIVAEKTGYPSDMLELDLDLEADLGVDTVKQAETFAAVREAYGIPRLDDLKLRDFPTLRHVVGFVHTHRPDLAAATALTPPVATASTASMAHTDAAAPATDARRYDVEDANRVPRRVVVPSLRPSLTLCRATSVALPPGARVVVGMDGRGVGLALADRLATRGVSVLPVPEDAAADWLDAQMVTWLAEGPIAGVYWLPALDCEPDVAALDLDGFREANRRRTKNLFAVMRPLADVVSKPGTFLVSATSMGGVFGYDADGATAPLGGGVAGFTKAFKRERPDALVKVVDVSAEAPAAAVAEAMLSETLHDPGVVEIGYRDGLRWTLTFDDVPAEDDRSGLTLSADTVYLVTGAAGGITSAIVADLAQAGGGVFYLLDLVDAPAADDRHVALLRTDREQLKAVLIDEARARGDRPTPVTIDRALLAIERRDAARRAIEAVEAAGGDARYRTVDLLDGAAVAAVVDEVRAAHGRLDVLVHAGGIEISRALGEKPRAEFDLVFDIKADGYFSLLRAAEGLPIGASVVFSSVAGRFGNSGQTDYSAANALLCAMSRALRRTRPETRAIAIDWTAWAGIGMATRGSIPKIMEAAGIEMLDPAVGVPTVRRELTAGSRADEIVVGGRLGILAAEWDETGGLDVDRMAVALAGRRQPLGMVGEVRASLLHGGFIAATTLDPGQQPFLHDHRIDGTPVLPGVMGTEAFAQIASALCPDLTVVGVEDAEFLLPFKFFRDQPATLSLRADGRPGTGGDVVVRTSLHSRVQPRPDLPAQDREHFRALVRMRRESPAPLQISFTPPDRTAAAVTRDAIYRVYFHGPAYQVLEGVHLDNGTAVGPMVHGLPPNSVPADAAGLVAPRLIELCFQTAGIVGIARDRALGLPTAFRAVTVHRAPEHANGDRLFAVVTRREEDGVSYDARVVDSHGRVYVDVRGYRTIALAGAVELDDLDPPQG